MRSSPFLERPNGSGSLFDQIERLKLELSECKCHMKLEKETHNAKVATLESQVRQQTELLENAGKDKEFLYDEVSTLKDKLRVMEDEGEKQRDQNEKVIRALELSNNNQRAQCQSLKSENKFLKAKYEDTKDELQKIKDSFDTEIQDVNNRLASAVKENQYKDSVLKDLLDTVEELKKEKALEISGYGHQETMHFFEKEMTSQSEYIKDLEEKNMRLSVKLSTLESKHDLVEVMREEKLLLEGKLSHFEELHEKLKQIEKERLRLHQIVAKWQNDLAPKSGEQFDSPQEFVAKYCSIRSRMEGIEESLKKSQEQVANLQKTKVDLRAQVSTSQAEVQSLQSKSKDDALTIKKMKNTINLFEVEVEFKKSTIQSMKVEIKMLLSSRDSNENDIVNQLETQIEAQQKSIDQQNAKLEMFRKDSEALSRVPKKRRLSDDKFRQTNTELVVELEKKKQELNNLSELKDDLQRKNFELESEVTKARETLQSLEKSSKNSTGDIKVLELKDNPTTSQEKFSLDLLNTLRQENEDLTKLLEGKTVTEQIPKSVYSRLSMELAEKTDLANEANKRLLRLRQMYQKKTQEFNGVIFKLLGYKVEFISPSRFKVMSRFGKQSSDEWSNYAVVNLEGNEFSIDDSTSFADLSQSDFDGLIDFWINNKKDFTCFLSAVNLSLFEKYESSGMGVKVE